ncbi:PAS domain S-box-containing protein [Paraburkholderia sp. BL18I3N2]|uniref:hybrid sensor histidine kinase/response regulator n=1 Tax=Paraburkholderia sp. BL18I3N2 TaxID=1938799 RepID=UPI000D061F15|nr:PAS domain S-box protein [Paraburkholderia sp. BL18I3N2]PRX32179.1 PAS domain S-box-containing protein [Paraburkholderia sp. BL18I3N2]
MSDVDPKSGEFSSVWLRLWAESTQDYSIFALSPEGTVLTWNPGGERIQGYRSDEIIGQPFSVFYPEADRASGVPEAALQAATTAGRYVAEGWRVRKDGTTFWANVVMTALRDSHGQLIGFGKVVRDVSDKKAAHDAVLESERSFRLLVQGVTDYAIFMLSPDGHITSWNAGARRIKGYTEKEIIGSHFSRFYTPEDVAAGVPFRGLETARRDGRFEAEGWRVRRDGSRFFAHVVIDAIREEGELVGFAKVTRDITERRRASELLEQTQSALFQAQKMEALGKLTGGVAHDFNNVLQVLRGNLELLESRHGRDGWSAERLGNALDAVDRGAKLASQLLAFGRQQPLEPVVINPARQLQALDDLLRRALGETIEIESVVAGGLWNTIADPHQLENVILNLAINARDAMPDGGKLTLELANATLDDEYVSALTDVTAGQYVMLAVTDTGTGMTREVMERAFDPFFSTKPEGRGTGLGLSMAYGFVKQSGGHIRLYSEVSEGTTVKIYLPRSTGTAVETRRSTGGVLKHGSETILVVEDDLKVQATVVELLSGLGYAVLKANDAEQALAVVASGVHVDLLFTDVVMPGALRSPEMARRAVQMLPGLKVLFTSGYTQNAIVHGGRLDPGVELLSKPYSRQQLAVKVRQVLGNSEIEAMEPRAPAARSGDGVGSVANGQGPRILIVEDDAASLEATFELLTLIGMRPRRADSAAAALNALQDEDFDVLFTDIVMPDMSGTELARRAASIRPELKIIFASGNPVPVHERFEFEWSALRKPFTLDQLRAALQPAMRPLAEPRAGNRQPEKTDAAGKGPGSR